jgi:CBS domain-containing protein
MRPEIGCSLRCGHDLHAAPWEDKAMLVRDVMKEPVCVQAEGTLDAAARRLKKENIGALPVWQECGRN